MIKLIREFSIEFPSNYDYLRVVALSYAFFMAFYRILSPKLSKLLFKSYSNLSPHHKIEWNSRLTSTVFALTVSSICLFVLLVDKGIASSPLIYYSKLVETNISIVLGYILADMSIIITNYSIIGDFFTLFHHCVSIYGYTNALTYSVMPYFANFRLVVELSTPLVNMRWFLYACGYNKDSLHFFFNGIIMTIMFFMVRIVSIPIFWYKVYSVLDSPLWIKMKHFRYIMIGTCFCLDVVNVYWFKKIFRGALIVWSTNWQYYEKHHKAQQLKILHAYQRLLKDKILGANNVIFQSTKNGWNIINPSKYINAGLIDRRIPKIVSDFLSKHPAGDHAE